MSNVYITYQCQLAAATFLKTKTITGLDSGSIYAGITRDVDTDAEEPTQELPRVVCLCQRAEADALDSGNWKARLSIALETAADDSTAADHATMANAVFSEFLTSTAHTDLSGAITDFTAFRVNPLSQSWDIDGRLWIAEMEFEVYCCGSDIS